MDKSAASVCMGCMSPLINESPCPVCGWQEGTLPESPLHLGSRTLLLDRYVIGRVLGCGGFGVTYLAWDAELELKVAIKEFLPDGLASRAAGDKQVTVFGGEGDQDYQAGMDKFLGEARVLAKFRANPNIISIYNFFKTNGTAYIVMEYVEGISLSQYLADSESGRISLAEALTFLMPVSDALRDVHTEGLLHRDISPDNIFLTKDYKVKLLDFGAARQSIAENNKSLSVLLKPGYAPVEQYSSIGSQGAWTDVYALAATFYKLIVGKTPPESIDRLQGEEVPTPASLGIELPEGLAAVLTKALALQPANRYQTVMDFKLDLERAISGEQISAAEVNQQRVDAILHKAEPENFNLANQGNQPIRPQPQVAVVQQPVSRDWKKYLPVMLAGGGVVVLLVVGLVIYSVISHSPANLFKSAMAFKQSGNLNKAAELMKQSAQKDYGDAQLELAAMYDEGKGVPQNPQQAAEYYQKAAEKGTVQAQVKLAEMYRAGRGVTQNNEEAFKWYQKAADAGSEDAQYNLGICYEEGKGTKQDDALAAKFYEKASGKLPDAQFRLGRLYYKGEGVAADKKKALELYEKAAAAGQVDAQVEAGKMYADADGVERDYAKALKLITQAAEKDNQDAQYYSGVMYENGYGVKRDFIQAAQWYKKAADKGYIKAQTGLAVLYIRGEGVPKDLAKGYEMMKKAAEQGYDKAQYWIGYMNQQGTGVAQNYAEAAKWYQKAADQNNADAQFELGLLYGDGKGVEMDLSKAFQLMLKAAKQGNVSGQYYVGIMYIYGTGVAVDAAVGSQYVQKAAEQGDEEAQAFLGLLYETGTGVAKDLQTAAKWYSKAAAQGNQAASDRLDVFREAGVIQ